MCIAADAVTHTHTRARATHTQTMCARDRYRLVEANNDFVWSV